MPIRPLPTEQVVGLDGQNYRVLKTRGQFAVKYLEVIKYAESWAQDNVTNTRTVMCLWEDRYKLVSDFLGTSVFQQGNRVGGVVTNIKRYIPEDHPELDWMFASQMELTNTLGPPTSNRENIIKALQSAPKYGDLKQYDPAPGSEMVRFNLAEYAVTYTPRDYEVSSDTDTPDNGFGELNRYLSVYYTPSGSNQPYAGSHFHWVSTPTEPLPINATPALTIPKMELHYLWREVPRLERPTILKTIGKCNNRLFSGQYPPETLLCEAPKISQIRTATGNFVFNIEYIFVYREKTWNAILRRVVPANGDPDPGKSPGFDKIIGNDNVTKATPTEDFDKLFVLT